ncbi:YbaK/EbsC family protein [Thermobifida halotolerans]|uniref:YbaK/EbsC family protein n=1 Tax=Thermobifida halotolerans TaxID=483545 RepID=UPI000A00C382|nr:YbaK/EbsC family protein [Thermobifida halotolerans]
MHPNARRVADLLAAHGTSGTVRELPDSARTAAAAAAQLGCEVGAIANSLVFAVRHDGPPEAPDADLRPVLVLTSGAHRVDTKKVAVLLGAVEVVRATPEFVRAHTGQPIGGVAPLGHPAPIPTLVDEWLDRHDVVWAAAGHPHTVFPTSFAELCRLTGGPPADVGQDRL